MKDDYKFATDNENGKGEFIRCGFQFILSSHNFFFIHSNESVLN